MSFDSHAPKLRSLLLETKDGEWGNDAPSEDSTEMIVIRGTDFERAGQGLLAAVPVRHIAKKAAERKSLRPNDILIETAGGTRGKPTGKTVLLKPHLFERTNLPITCSSFARFLRVNKELAHPEYVYWYLQYLYKSGVMENHQVQHTGIARFQFTKFAEATAISLPPRNVQVCISNFLGAIDDRIALLRETNATLEAIAQALFKSWFVDFDPVRAKVEGREPEGMDDETARLFPHIFEESELGPIPKGWRCGTVGQEIVTVDYVANGSFAALKENVTLLSKPGYALYLRTTDYNSGFNGEFRYVDKSAYDFLSKSSLTASDVVISNVGDVGTVFRPPAWLGFPMTLGSNAVALKNPTMSSYLFHYFKGDRGQHALRSIVTGSAQLKFNKTNLRSLKLLIPPDDVLATFEQATGPLLSSVDENHAQSRTLASLRDTLLPRLITGQLRLPEAEALLQDAA